MYQRQCKRRARRNEYGVCYCTLVEFCVADGLLLTCLADELLSVAYIMLSLINYFETVPFRLTDRWY